MIDADTVVSHLTTGQMEAGMEHVLRSPAHGGPLVKIVRRPDMERREVIAEGELDVELGLVGDNWKARAAPAHPTGARIPWPRSP